MFFQKDCKRNKRKICFQEVFLEWLGYKVNLDGLSLRSYDRYLSDYERFFRDEALFEKTPIRQIKEKDLELYIRKTITCLNLTNRGYARIRLILRGVFKYAYRKRFTTLHIDSCLDELDLSDRIFAKKLKPDELEVFTPDEEAAIIRYIDSRPPVLTGQGIKLLFLTGLRIGEIATLTRDDIHGQYIRINKTETSYKERDSAGKVLRIVYEVRPFPKTEAGIRTVIIPPSALAITDTVLNLSYENTDGYLFYGAKGRMHGAVFSQRLRNICKELGLPPRSAHKIRKTYATKLINSGLEKSLIIKQMGHTDFTTTDRFYYYNNTKKEEMVTKICQALEE